MTTFQSFAKMLNHCLYDDIITADEAIEFMCEKMPLTFKPGEWSSPKRGGVMVLRKRLVCWDSNDGEPLKLRDLEIMLEGN